MRREIFYLERFRSLTDRALAFGATDWTVQYDKAAQELLNDLHEELGAPGKCESCGEQSFVKPTEVGHPNPDRLLLCPSCRNEEGWDTREVAA